MTEFLQSNITLVVGVLLILAIAPLRAFTADQDLRQDLHKGLLFLVGFLVLRLCAWALDGALADTARSLLSLAWMMVFAFGVIRISSALLMWGLRFRRATPTPKILRDTISVVLYGLVAIPILKATLKIDVGSLVATSAILSVVLGLALQDTLGNLFAGLSLQLERPFEVGDFVSVGEHVGAIAQIGWRATRIETFRGEQVTLPNNVVAKGAVKNYSRATAAIGTDLTVDVSYDAPPNVVKATVLETLAEIPGCVREPAPLCRVQAFGELGVRYQIRFFCRMWDQAPDITEQLLSRLWYRLGREGIEVPPQRALRMREPQAAKRLVPEEIHSILQTVDLLAALKDAELRAMADELHVRAFGRGERVIAEGAPGKTFYVVASGEVSVRAGTPGVEVTKLRRGGYFGEMSLLTGEPRAATVIATEDSVLLELDRPLFARFLSERPEAAHALSELLARRKGELLAASVQGGGAVTSADAPEARRIFTRLLEIFRLDGLPIKPGKA